MADGRDSKSDREARLAEALRANLRRRKRQARDRAAETAEPPASQEPRRGWAGRSETAPDKEDGGGGEDRGGGETR